MLAVTCGVILLQPAPAAAQAGCDPTTSYCGGITGNSNQQQPLPLPTTPSNQQNPYQQNPYGAGGGGFNPEATTPARCSPWICSRYRTSSTT